MISSARQSCLINVAAGFILDLFNGVVESIDDLSLSLICIYIKHCK